MSEISTHKGHFHVQNRLSCGELIIPDGALLDAAVGSSAAIQASKLNHQHVLEYHQPNGTDVVSETQLIGIIRATGTVHAVQVASAVAPDGDADFYTVQINRIRAAASVNVLTAVITYNNTNAPANYDILDGTINGANDDLIDDDVLQAVITVTNNGGAQAQGLTLIVTIREAAD